MELRSINPANGKPLKKYAVPGPSRVDQMIRSSASAQLAWKEWPVGERAALLENAARILKDRSAEWGRLMALEMGKPIGQGIAEAEKCASACTYYALNSEKFLAPEQVETDASQSMVVMEPLGVVLGVMPWNFPFWQVFRFAVPTITAGNGVLLKHASNVPGCAIAIEKIFQEAGFPAGLFKSLVVPSGQVPAILNHPLVSAVSLTGSTGAGKDIARKAGSLLKKAVLELGGSDAYLILEDADLDMAAETCVNSRLINNGESCIAAKRFIIVQEVFGEFLEKFNSRMASRKMGDPLDPSTQVGPLARTDLRDSLHRQVRKSIRLGARCVLGGSIPEGPGAFYPPTVLTGVKKGMPAFDEELFGPVAALIRAKDEKQAIALANDSSFGLGAAVFTRDPERGTRIARSELDAGNCFVNGLVKSDPRLPFGGIKQSGYGRELGAYGIREFVNIKTVWVR
ncbi:MAG TPA: NAD-dependent succinate-semialdehyde dehydrogenase [Chitinophagaceae bacterium]|nr:NAD-dependent succinate-semialdehyde dehydrogenase [Chitinophagaceae bacterium]